MISFNKCWVPVEYRGIFWNLLIPSLHMINKKIVTVIVVIFILLILTLCCIGSIVTLFVFGMGYMTRNIPISEKDTSALLNEKYKELCNYESVDLDYKYIDFPSNAHTVGVGYTKYTTAVIVSYKGVQIFDGNVYVMYAGEQGEPVLNGALKCAENI